MKAFFLTSSLLISHGVRRDVVAVVQDRNRYVIVRGDKVKHLRPDQDSAEGYIRAVLSGKAEPLGAEIVPEISIPRECLNITIEKGIDLFKINLRNYNTFIYGEPVDNCIDAYIGVDIPPELQPVIVNILLDRIGG